ncbi:unnamed protein product [Danaus chrysippus]|uniref:(African queen) hypothetical protein n=1 Tax=Danaus chrysippus TaxID=151541 RepID=A0A8J2W6F0_9NEOP|nr:unnamed protein product [Danaus chrysippus]
MLCTVPALGGGGGGDGATAQGAKFGGRLLEIPEASAHNNFWIFNSVNGMLRNAYFSCNSILGLIFTLPSIVNLIKPLFGIEAPRILPFFYWLPFDPYQEVIFEVVVIVQNSHCKYFIYSS